MLGVLAIVAVIAAGGTYSLEFTEEKFQELYKIELPAKPIKTEFVNADKPLPQQNPKKDNRGGVFFYLLKKTPQVYENLPPKMGKYYCGEHNGIYLIFPYQNPDKDVACKICYFRWVAQRLETGNSVFTYFTIYFQYGYYGPIVLVIPVFQTPAQGSPEGIRQWAEENQVGLLDPSIQQQFKIALSSQPILLENFDWLSNLLSYGIFKFQRQLSMGGVKAKSYVTRPVLLSQDTIELLKTTVQNIGVGDNPTNAGSSSSHQSKDDAMSYFYLLDEFKSDQSEFSDIVLNDTIYEEAMRDDNRLRQYMYTEDFLLNDDLPPRKHTTKRKSRK